MLDLFRLPGVRGLVIGGIAASLLGRPRYTADVDAMVVLEKDLDDLGRLVEAAAGCGLVPRIPDAVVFARRNRVLLLIHEQSGVPVDVAIGLLPFELEAVERGQTFVIGSVSVPLPTPEDLVIMKAVAHRPRDIEDIRAVVAAYPQLDRERVRRVICDFAAALEMPELWEDVRQIVEGN